MTPSATMLPRTLSLSASFTVANCEKLYAEDSSPEPGSSARRHHVQPQPGPQPQPVAQPLTHAERRTTTQSKTLAKYSDSQVVPILRIDGVFTCARCTACYRDSGQMLASRIYCFRSFIPLTRFLETRPEVQRLDRHPFVFNKRSTQPTIFIQ